MREFEKKISPLIENMFPTLYKEGGEDFIAFVKAYFEWLENNHQIITLEIPTTWTGTAKAWLETYFPIGSKIQQEDITGDVIAYVGNDVLVHVDGLQTFKCFNVCSELIPVTSSVGGTSYILRGGTTRRLGTLFLARNLMNMRDIDKTLDLFVIRFKEKFLKNIEFDVRTNKQLLIKNSLDLYRAKGTERAIDLFFRLVYGENATVRYPGEDVFKLSDGQWIKPKYLEIAAPNPTRAIELVGKEIHGVTSNATAFVEKYVKRKIKNGFVHILELANIRGEFINRELLRSDRISLDSPTVIGSLNSVDIVSGGRDFRVGDVVNFNSSRGDYGQARVAEVSNKTGIVDFLFVDGGFGYTVSGDTNFTEADLETKTQSIISEKVITLSNVVTSNAVSRFNVVAAGTGYSNLDLAVARSPYQNAVGRIVTTSTGAISYVVISNPGSGFYVNTTSNVVITNSTGGTANGTGATLTALTKDQTGYFNYFEPFTQQFATVDYNAATNNQLFSSGDQVYIGNSTVNNAFGVVISNVPGASVDANGTMIISVLNNGKFGAGNTITLTTNTSIKANAQLVTNTSASAAVMGIPNTALLTVTSIANGTIERGDEVYQLNAAGEETGNAYVQGSVTSGIASASVDLIDLKGVIRQGRTLRVRTKNTTANVGLVQLTVGLYNIVNNYSNAQSSMAFSSNTGTVGNVISVSSGSGASFRVGTISETETIYLNTDLLRANNTPISGANQAYMTVPLNAEAYGFPKNQSGNSSTIIFSCLNFDLFTIGTIASINNINPGTEYNVDPYVLAYQPYISGFERRDYIIEINNATGDFNPGERIEQILPTLTKYDLVVSDETGYRVGEKVYQGTSGSPTATGFIDSIVTATNTIRVRNVTGTFTATTLKSYITPALAATVSSITPVSESVVAKGIIKSANTTHLQVKRIQFDNNFIVDSSLTGSQSGSSATITSIIEDMSTLPIGLNAQIEANVVTSNGVITNLEIIDSGVGYSTGDIILFTSEDGERSGEAKTKVSGIGTGRGYYKTSKGFLSSLSKVHDGDYYQEYSYEIMLRIPVSRYAEMFKKVMHTAGTKFFGAVLLEEVVPVSADYSDTQFSKTYQKTVRFNSNTNISNSFITVTNQFANGDKVTYTAIAGNTAVELLSNNSNYYINSANATHFRLVTNPRTVSATFNKKTSVNSSANFVTLTRHNFVENDYVKYTVSAGNTALSGLTSNSNYFVVEANSSGIKLASTRGGSPINIAASTTSQNGHTLSITAINIVANTTASGASTNGHFIALVNEI